MLQWCHSSYNPQIRAYLFSSAMWRPGRLWLEGRAPSTWFLALPSEDCARSFTSKFTLESHNIKSHDLLLPSPSAGPRTVILISFLYLYHYPCQAHMQNFTQFWDFHSSSNQTFLWWILSPILPKAISPLLGGVHGTFSSLSKGRKIHEASSAGLQDLWGKRPHDSSCAPTQRLTEEMGNKQIKLNQISCS